MKYFLDTEFVESPGKIDLISIGIVAENGKEFYAEVDEIGPTNEWVEKNVIPHLWQGDDYKDQGLTFNAQGGTGGCWPKHQIGPAILDWVDSEPEFWGYYADYDWVVLCWLFGAMIDLPAGWPMYCNDIKQLAVSKGNPRLPEQSSTEHHALQDARWNKQAYTFLQGQIDES